MPQKSKSAAPTKAASKPWAPDRRSKCASCALFDENLTCPLLQAHLAIDPAQARMVVDCGGYRSKKSQQNNAGETPSQE